MASIEQVQKILERHEREDDRRFNALELRLAKLSGQLAFLIVLVVASGTLNYFGR